MYLTKVYVLSAGPIFTKGIKLNLSQKSAQIYSCLCETLARFLAHLELDPFCEYGPVVHELQCMGVPVIDDACDLQGLISRTDLSLVLDFGLKFCQKCAKSAGLDVVDFTKGLSPWIC